MVNLLGCPFCGGNPTLINGGPGNCYVRCTKCKSSSNDVSRDRATELWNTRALSIPNAPGEQREDKRANQVIGEAIKKHTYGSIRGTLTKAIVSELHRNGFSILAVRLDEAAIRKDEREKCAKVCKDYAQWAESKIDSETSIFGTVSNTADDLAERRQAAVKLTETSWFEVDVERPIEVDRGRDTILADRWGRGHGTVLLKLSDASKAGLHRALEQSQEGK